MIEVGFVSHPSIVLLNQISDLTESTFTCFIWSTRKLLLPFQLQSRGCAQNTWSDQRRLFNQQTPPLAFTRGLEWIRIWFKLPNETFHIKAKLTWRHLDCYSFLPPVLPQTPMGACASADVGRKQLAPRRVALVTVRFLPCCVSPKASPAQIGVVNPLCVSYLV